MAQQSLTICYPRIQDHNMMILIFDTKIMMMIHFGHEINILCLLKIMKLIGFFFGSTKLIVLPSHRLHARWTISQSFLFGQDQYFNLDHDLTQVDEAFGL